MTSLDHPLFCRTPAHLRDWFRDHADSATELFVRLAPRSAPEPGMSWSEAVDEALCVGWIDGIGRSLGELGRVVRFTPRRPRSIWSAVNIDKVARLLAEGRMTPAGLAAFERRTAENSRVYSHERTSEPVLDEAAEARFRAHPAAWDFFHAQPRGYRRTALHWVTTAKRDETRERRLLALITDSAAGRRLAQFDSRR